MFTALPTKSYQLKAKKGFTLIEILVVIAIIGVLAALGLANYNASRRNARDSRRLGDIRSIMTALEQYYNDNNSYPDALSGLVSSNYLDRVPTDPKIPAGCIFYIYSQTGSGTGYELRYSLERTNSQALGTLNATTECTTDYFVTR